MRCAARESLTAQRGKIARECSRVRDKRQHAGARVATGGQARARRCDGAIYA